MNMEGTPPPLRGRALPNLINAVSMLKSKSKTALVLTLTLNILTAFIRLGRAGPVGAGCPPYYYFLTLIGRDGGVQILYLPLKPIVNRKPGACV